MIRFFLNDRAGRLGDALLADHEGLGIARHEIAGAEVVDCGVHAPGGLAAGIALARLCLADLGHVELDSHRQVATRTDHPVAACLASQYAGWQVKHGEWFGMVSGPIRAHAGREPLFDEIGHRESAQRVIGVVEAAQLPSAAAVEQIISKLGTPAPRVSLWVAPTASLAGGVQVVARTVEVALHKLHTLKYDLGRIVAGIGAAPLPPPGKNDLQSLGRTNDAILYAGQVTLVVDDDDEQLSEIGPRVPSSSSPAFGQLFLELLKAANYDFYAMDPLLFAPAEITLQNRRTGRQFRFGEVHGDAVAKSFGVPR